WVALDCRERIQARARFTSTEGLPIPPEFAANPLAASGTEPGRRAVFHRSGTWDNSSSRLRRIGCAEPSSRSAGKAARTSRERPFPYEKLSHVPEIDPAPQPEACPPSR